ncbi:UNVERIFIED_CONTAM: hypothetical protein Slati_2131000 [Sesamum latifolium]|uniref:Reverse transcriptase zinc-binding domain-containing protein n=1 Tax=Sesamum latifolium TaxID=2727402 RepID=A0AAW2WRD2_9LAMI
MELRMAGGCPSKGPLVHMENLSQCTTTLVNLKRRGMDSDFGCPWCSDSEENLLHSLLCFHYPRLIWTLSGLPYTAYNADQIAWKARSGDYTEH